jgi:hypothetical protein
MDVSDVWQGTIEHGVAEATRAIREQFAEEPDREIVFFALASLQLDAGQLDDAVKESALASIADNVAHWEQWAAPDDAAERRQVMEELRRRLETFAT